MRDTHQNLLVTPSLRARSKPNLILGQIWHIEKLKRVSYSFNGNTAIVWMREEFGIDQGRVFGVCGAELYLAGSLEAHEGYNEGEVLFWGYDGGGANVLRLGDQLVVEI